MPVTRAVETALRPVMDAMLNPPLGLRSLRRVIGGSPADLSGTVVLLTGASSGIGEATARLLASRGATVLAVARTLEPLQEVCSEISESGGTAYPLTADLSDPDDAQRLAREVLDRFGVPDVLVNNAGRSIRRTALESVDRFHDYQRTMAVNYFGPAALTLGLLPAMIDRGSGHIVNVVTWGVDAGAMPRFGAYHASKSALAAFGRSLDAECDGTGVAVTNAGFPLVRTPMIAPTASYDDAPMISAEQAAAWILRAIDERPAELYPAYTGVLRAIGDVSPRIMGRVITRLGI
ncbi:SDR family NAD(P)-dependent oxidoreductase [Gordonia humi]|uniref:NAD(P)-dependent dehydrogenase (Short-subunit alcohol dehydrogenase family) n=1 Tax=Gordonia humi TaxID=686429 RepID=A0A840F7D0_9ACTN|nr:SDR family NAD(P)-dependent oxidoreductase [Gordonia humi]MBB4135437.1 NAD(P)-dependent dehydrogenase (short-subunit alcohol dehydrogenase family) [Gordonia humi]